MSQPGRSCPLHYRYRPDVFACDAPAQMAGLEVLYIVGGLYGNEAALDRVLEMFDRERGRKRLVFNGDFHWFDAEPDAFFRVQSRVLEFDATRGNVETELADESATSEAGCGCGYPDWVEDLVVERSNRILARLRSVTTPTQRRALAALPMWVRADVGNLRLGIVHGDAESLAGWGFAQEQLHDARHRAQVNHWFEAARVDAFACTHTCLPVFQCVGSVDGGRWVLNNGAAGMPNFIADRAGLLTRVAIAPVAGAERRYGVVHFGIHIDALAIEYDARAFNRQFIKTWPAGSDAHASYFGRIERGPAYEQDQALRMVR